MNQRPFGEQRRRLLRGVTLGFIVLMALVFIADLAMAITMHEDRVLYTVDLVLTVLMAGAAIGVQALARRERYDTAAAILIGALATRAIVTVGIIVPEKVQTLAPAYLVVIVLAQVLLSSRAGVLAGLGCVPMFAATYANAGPETLDQLPGVISSSLFVYLAVGGFLDLALRSMQRSVHRSNVLLAENERARRELQENEEQFRAITASSPTGIVIQQDGHLVYANPRFAEMAHCLSEDAYGLSLWDFLNPEDVDLLRGRLRGQRRGRAAQILSHQLVLNPIKAEPIWCEVAIVNAVYRDREAVLATILDVSDRVQAQLEVRRERDFTSNIINAADAIITVLDKDGMCIRFNPAGERLLGYAEQEMLGKPFWETLGPPEAREQVLAFLRAIPQGRLRGQLETVWPSKAGEDRHIAWRYVAQTSQAGEVSSIILVGIDVTQQRLLEKQSMATERLRGLGQMAGGVAHDLNNTLAGILGPAELLLETEDSSERSRELRTIVSAASRGAETVRRIQRFSQARTDTDRQVFDLGELVADVVSTLRPRWRDQAQRAGITITINQQVPEDLLLTGSSGEIGNVLTNLVVNACEAMPQGGAITISAQQDGAMTHISVTDTGSGMSPETAANVFEPFFSTKGADNSGLGLAVIRGIVLRHGGNIDVASELGKGTTFRVSLPAATSIEEEGEKPRVAVAQTGPLSFLVVDDTPAIADFAVAALQRLGHEAVAMYGGGEALGCLQQQPYDVLLTDYGMEGLSGVNLAGEAKRLHPQIKTVVMTGWDFMAEEFLEVDASLGKPFTLGQLQELIQQSLSE